MTVLTRGRLGDNESWGGFLGAARRTLSWANPLHPPTLLSSYPSVIPGKERDQRIPNTRVYLTWGLITELFFPSENLLKQNGVWLQQILSQFAFPELTQREGGEEAREGVEAS